MGFKNWSLVALLRGLDLENLKKVLCWNVWGDHCFRIYLIVREG